MLLSKLLFNLKSLSIGVSLYSGIIRHAIVYQDKNGKKQLISTGTGIPWYIKLLTPVIAHGDLLDTSVLVTSEDLGDTDPDQWIDKNEEKIIPTGFTSDQVVNEYEVHGSKLFSVTAAVKARDSVVERLGKDISPDIPEHAFMGFSSSLPGLYKCAFCTLENNRQWFNSGQSGKW